MGFKVKGDLKRARRLAYKVLRIVRSSRHQITSDEYKRAVSAMRSVTVHRRVMRKSA